MDCELLESECNDEKFIEMECQNNRNLDENWIEKSHIELGETKELAQKQVNKLRQLIIVSKLLSKGVRQDDVFLLRFLRAKKFDIDKSYKMFMKYHTMKEKSPELFKVTPLKDLQEILKSQIQLMLPHRDSYGQKVYIFRVQKLDPYKCPVETVFRTNILALENSIREIETQISGLVVILDMAGSGLAHAKFLAPSLSKKTVEVIQESFPMRFKAFHILNEPFYFDAILMVIKPFLRDKIRRRIHLHGSNLKSLHTHVPKEILPLEYGGLQSKFDNTEWRQQLISEEEYFQRLENYAERNINNMY